MPRIIVFGANGFIGKNLVRELATREPQSTIIAFDRFANASTQPFSDLANVKNVSGDFFNRADLEKVLPGTDYVFHLVTSTTPAVSNSDPFIDIDTNVRGTVDLLELCAEHKIKRILFPSSGGAVYGDVDSEKVSESTLPEPASPYGIGKLTIEHYLRYFKHTSGLDYIVYRIANPYGPGQNTQGNQGAIPIFMRHVLTNEQLNVYGDCSMMRDYLYIDDLIQMLVISYAKDHKFNEYNLGSGQGKTVNQLIRAIEACSKKTVSVAHTPTPPTFVHRSVLDIARFTTEFGSTPHVSFDEGIERTWQYVQQASK